MFIFKGLECKVFKLSIRKIFDRRQRGDKRRNGSLQVWESRRIENVALDKRIIEPKNGASLQQIQTLQNQSREGIDTGKRVWDSLETMSKENEDCFFQIRGERNNGLGIKLEASQRIANKCFGVI